MHIGLTPWDWKSLRTGAGVAEQAQQAEDLGFDSFWVPESHFTGERSVPAPLLLLAAAASVTRRITLGCVSYLLPIRNATLAAEEIAVMDRLCEGRLVLGLGRGIHPGMFDAFDINASDKRRLFAQRLEEIRALWAGSGALQSAPLPLQSPEPRLWAAALGPKALAQIAELGLPYLASPLESFDELATNLDNYRQQLPSGAETVTPIMRTVYITEDSTRATQLQQALADQLAKAGRYKDSPIEDRAIVGSAGFVQEELSRYREALGMTHLILRGGLPGISPAEQLSSFVTTRELIAQSDP